MIIINGEFEKAPDGQIAIDFEGLDATDFIGDSFYLISADTRKGFWTMRTMTLLLRI